MAASAKPTELRPSFVDRVIASVSPSWGLRRMESKVRLEAATRFFGGPGGFNGARMSRPAMKEWTPFPRSPDADAIPDLPALRGRSRDLERNAPIAAGALNTQVTSVVGEGLTPHPRVDREYLNLTDEEADAWERQASRLWTIWSTSRACDFERRTNFDGLTSLTLNGWLSGGDIFAVRRYSERPGDPFGLRVQLIEADRVSNPNRVIDTERLIGGIELDADSVPFRIHVADGYPGDWWQAGVIQWTPVEIYGAETGSLRVLHVLEQKRPGQTRGIPYLAPVIESLKQLDRYAEAELMAAVIASFFTVFIKTPALGDDSTDLLTDQGNPATKNAFGGGTTDIRLGQGTVLGLAEGEEIQIADPKRPNAQFDPFFRAFLNQVGVALDLPHELLIKQFTSSYSASRAALLEAWRGFKRRRRWLVWSFCQPTYEWMLEEAIARGLISAPGFLSDPLARQAWAGTAWSGPTMGQLNPMDEANAIEKRITVGVSTLQRETAELSGEDWESTHAQRSKEHKLRVAADLEPALAGASTTVRLTPNAPATSSNPDPNAPDNAGDQTPPPTPPADTTTDGTDPSQGITREELLSAVTAAADAAIARVRSEWPAPEPPAPAQPLALTVNVDAGRGPVRVSGTARRNADGSLTLEQTREED
jgi:lambda family phage portal protein